MGLPDRQELGRFSRREPLSPRSKREFALGWLNWVGADEKVWRAGRILN